MSSKIPYWDSFSCEVQCEDIYNGETMTTLRDRDETSKDFESGMLTKLQEKRSEPRQILWEADIRGTKTYFVTSYSPTYMETMSFISCSKGIITDYHDIVARKGSPQHNTVAEQTYLQIEEGL